jgi:hypothetical protein
MSAKKTTKTKATKGTKGTKAQPIASTIKLEPVDLKQAHVKAAKAATPSQG